MASQTTLLDSALAWAQTYPVFPLAPGSKVPLAGSHGFYDATTDEARIRQWFAANFGIRTGKESGIFVVDLDRNVPRTVDKRTVGSLLNSAKRKGWCRPAKLPLCRTAREGGHKGPRSQWVSLLRPGAVEERVEGS